MVESRILDDEELAEHDRREDCTGVTARWCPNCGDCECERDEEGFHLGHPGVDEDGNDCPLHGEHSKHAEAIT